MKMTDAEMDALVEQIIDRAGRESSADGMDGDRWDRILVRAALTARLAADQQKGGGECCGSCGLPKLGHGLLRPVEMCQCAHISAPQPSIPAPAHPDAAWKQAYTEISRTPLREIKGDLYQAVSTRADEIRAAQQDGKASGGEAVIDDKMINRAMDGFTFQRSHGAGERAAMYVALKAALTKDQQP
jgi:hypothetical protein